MRGKTQLTSFFSFSFGLKWNMLLNFWSVSLDPLTLLLAENNIDVWVTAPVFDFWNQPVFFDLFVFFMLFLCLPPCTLSLPTVNWHGSATVEHQNRLPHHFWNTPQHVRWDLSLQLDYHSHFWWSLHCFLKPLLGGFTFTSIQTLS